MGVWILRTPNLALQRIEQIACGLVAGSFGSAWMHRHAISRGRYRHRAASHRGAMLAGQHLREHDAKKRVDVGTHPSCRQ